MASAYRKNGKWYVRFRDPSGAWRDRATDAAMKWEARRVGDELEGKAPRERTAAPIVAGRDEVTVGKLFEWWLETYSRLAPSHGRNVYTVRKHFLNGDLAGVGARELPPLRNIDPWTIGIWQQGPTSSGNPRRQPELTQLPQFG